jgi:hypothetical protein
VEVPRVRMRRVSSFLKCSAFALSLTSGLSAACTESKSPDSPPNLIKLEVLDPSGLVLDIMPGVDAAMPQPVSSLSVIRATFDGLLDPSKVQDLSGASPALGRGVGKVRWDGGNGPAELGLLAQYNPSLRQGGTTPTVTFLAMEALPSGVSLSLILDKARLTDKAGNTYVGVIGGSFETISFKSVVELPAGPLPPSFLPRVNFTSLPANLPPGAIRVVKDGLDVAIAVSTDPSTRTGLIVARAGEGATWSVGTYQLILAADKITDLFGAPMVVGALSYTFVIGGPTGNVDAGGQDAGSPGGG